MVLTAFGFVIAERATNDFPRELSESLSFDVEALDIRSGGNTTTLKAMDQSVAAALQASADRSFTEALALVVEAGFTGNGALLADDALAFSQAARLTATAGQAKGAALVMATAAAITALSDLHTQPANLAFTATAAIQLTGNVAAVELFQAIALADMSMDADALMNAVLPFGVDAAFRVASGRLVDDLMRLGVACDLTASDEVTLRNQLQFAAAANLVSLGLTRCAKELEVAIAAGFDCSSFHYGPAELISLAAAARLSVNGFKLHELQIALNALADINTDSFVTSKPIEGACAIGGFIVQQTAAGELHQGGVLAASLEAHSLLNSLNEFQVEESSPTPMVSAWMTGQTRQAGRAKGQWFSANGPGVSVTPGQDSGFDFGGSHDSRSGGVSTFRFLRCI